MPARTRIAGPFAMALCLTLVLSLSFFIASATAPAAGGGAPSAGAAALGISSASATTAILPPGPYLRRPDLPRAVWATECVDVSGSIVGNHAAGPRVARLELWHAEGRVWVRRVYGSVTGIPVTGGLRWQNRLAPLAEGRWRAILIHDQDGSAARSTSAWTYFRSVRTKVMALTFDDGPRPGNTDDVLAVLTRYGVKATFFMIGNQVRAYPAVARKVLTAGHSIGNHSWNHAMLGKAGAGTIRAQIVPTTAQIKATTGVIPRWFRPPGGSTSSTVKSVCSGLGIRHVLWDIDPQDWRGRGAAYTINHVVSHPRPGAVVLMHDGPARRIGTAAAAAGVIRGLRAKGYDFITMDELGALRHYWR